jgi:hypothetical protein
MKFNKWTLGLAAVGVVSLASAVQAEETTNTVLTALSSTTISGYVDTSAQWNPGTGNANTPPYAFGKGKADGFNLNVVQLSLAKPLDESQWAAGYHVDLWLGPDAKFLGTSSYLGLANYASDFGIRQAYVALRTPIGNGIDWKIGVFDTVVGYESLSSPDNPHYTHSYGFSIEPTTHTGILGTYQVGDSLSVSAGVANTVGPSINDRAFGTPIPVALYGSPSIQLPLGGDKAESYKTYMGSIALTAPQSFGFLAGSSLYGGIVSGFSSGTYGDQINYYAGATVMTPVTGLKFGAAFDYLSAPKNAFSWVNASGLGSGPNYINIPDVWTLGIYSSFQATEKLTFLGRGEYLNTESGSGNIYALTATAQYDLWKNVLSRVEFRWDHAEHGDLFGGTPPTVSNIGSITSVGSALSALEPAATRANAFMIAANIIYKF